MSSTPSSNLRAALHSQLSQQLSGGQGDDLAYHLADLHGGLSRAAERIEELSALSGDTQQAELRRILSSLMGELYEHLPSHLDEARRLLDPWVDNLYAEAEARGEL